MTEINNDFGALKMRSRRGDIVDQCHLCIIKSLYNIRLLIILIIIFTFEMCLNCCLTIDVRVSELPAFLHWDRYQNQYPILGLLSDDYQYTAAPVRESKTIVIKRTGEMTKKVP